LKILKEDEKVGGREDNSETAWAKLFVGKRTQVDFHRLSFKEGCGLGKSCAGGLEEQRQDLGVQAHVRSTE